MSVGSGKPRSSAPRTRTGGRSRRAVADAGPIPGSRRALLPPTGHRGPELLRLRSIGNDESRSATPRTPRERARQGRQRRPPDPAPRDGPNPRSRAARSPARSRSDPTPGPLPFGPDLDPEAGEVSRDTDFQAPEGHELLRLRSVGSAGRTRRRRGRAGGDPARPPLEARSTALGRLPAGRRGSRRGRTGAGRPRPRGGEFRGIELSPAGLDRRPNRALPVVPCQVAGGPRQRSPRPPGRPRPSVRPGGP